MMREKTYPSEPLVGEGWGGGFGKPQPPQRPPTLTLPHKGGRE